MREDLTNFVSDLSQRDFTVFAGAGIPKPTGIPDWKDLLKELAEEHSLDGIINIDEIPNYLYPEVAQMVFTSYEIKGKIEDYYRIIRKKLDSKDASHIPLQRKLIQAGGSIITTNLDNTFEAAFKEENKALRLYQKEEIGYGIQYLPKLKEEDARKKNFITYLHGRYDQRNIILTTADYEKYYMSTDGVNKVSVIENLLRYVFEEHILVFIGFSFSDRYLNRLLKKISDDVKRKSIEESEVYMMRSGSKRKRHYALLDEINFGNNDYLLQNINKFERESNEFKQAMMLKRRIELEERLENMGIKVVRYDYEKHKQMENWFGDIAEKQKFNRGEWIE